MSNLAVTVAPISPPQKGNIANIAVAVPDDVLTPPETPWTDKEPHPEDRDYMNTHSWCLEMPVESQQNLKTSLAAERREQHVRKVCKNFRDAIWRKKDARFQVWEEVAERRRAEDRVADQRQAEYMAAENKRAAEKRGVEYIAAKKKRAEYNAYLAFQKSHQYHTEYEDNALIEAGAVIGLALTLASSSGLQDGRSETESADQKTVVATTVAVTFFAKPGIKEHAESGTKKHIRGLVRSSVKPQRQGRASFILLTRLAPEQTSEVTPNANTTQKTVSQRGEKEGLIAESEAKAIEHDLDELLDETWKFFFRNRGEWQQWISC